MMIIIICDKTDGSCDEPYPYLYHKADLTWDQLEENGYVDYAVTWGLDLTVLCAASRLVNCDTGTPSGGEGMGVGVSTSILRESDNKYVCRLTLLKDSKGNYYESDYPICAMFNVNLEGVVGSEKYVMYSWLAVKISGRAILVSFEEAGDRSSVVKGMAADGVSRVVVKMSNLSKDTHLGDVLIRLKDTDGRLEDDAKIANKVYTQTMKAPEFFVRKGHSSKDRSEGSRPIDLSITVNQKKLDIPEFTINKAPVVLLHGLWSNASVWNVFKAKLKSEYAYKYVGGYSYIQNAAHLKQNSGIIDTAIKKALRYCKDDGIVAKKADVVAHSMGGLLTKLYGNASNIKSITTVGTPHLGSECADILYQIVDDADSNKFEKFFADLFAATGHPATYGAVEDMRTHADGSAIAAGNKINVPTHTIAGITSLSETSTVSFVNLLSRIFMMHGIVPARATLSLRALNQYIFKGERNDWIVSESSQKGGMQGDDVSVTWHSAETDNTEVMDNIADFLHRTSNESTTGTALVNAQDVQINNYQQQRFQHKLPNIKMANSSGVVTITQPTEGTVFHPGDTVDVTVTVSNKNAKVLIATSTVESTLVESAPYNFQFVIPEDSAGTITIMAAATDDTGFIGSDEITITVAVSSKLTDITVYPEDSPLYLTVGETVPLTVYGKYDDNITREITSSSSGTLYTSANSDVAEVSSEGNITAKSQGDAVVAVENSKIKKEITITVMPDDTPTPVVSPSPTPASSPTLTPIPTPTTECTATSITASENSLTVKKRKKSSVIVSVTGDGDCAVKGKKVTAKVNASGKKMVTVKPASAKTGEDGSATFKLKAKSKTGNTSITFSTEDGLSGSVEVTVTK